MICRLEAITPIHIGTGYQIGMMDLIQYGKMAYLLNVRELFIFLKKTHGTNILKKFEGFVKDKTKTQSRGRGLELTLNKFLDENYISIEEIIENPSMVKYKVHAPFDVSRDIREHIKTDKIPYVPGSSLKGAIRGALLWYHVKADADRLISSLKRDLSRPSKKNIGKRFVDDFFSTDSRKYDAKYDILKFLEISDFMPLSYDLSIENVKTYSLKHDGFEAKQYDNFVESMKGCMEGRIGLSSQIKAAFKDEREYPLLRDKLNILGLKSDLNEEDMVNHIKDVMKEFNDWCLTKEIELCEKANDSNFSMKLDRLKRPNREEGLIRIGFAVGTIYQTLIKLIEEKDEELFFNIIDKLELHGLKRQKSYLYGNNLREIPYPKSIEFTMYGEPMGWLKWV